MEYNPFNHIRQLEDKIKALEEKIKRMITKRKPRR